MQHENTELYARLTSDIGHLERLRAEGLIDIYHLEEASVILRRLLFSGPGDNVLGLTSRALDMEVLLESRDMKGLVKILKNGNIMYFDGLVLTIPILGGKARFSTGPHVIGNQRPTDAVDAAQNRARTNKVHLPIKSYLRQIVFFFEGTQISRETVIRYVCNKIGTVHFDRTRDKDYFTVLDRMRNCVLLSTTGDNPCIAFNRDYFSSPHGNFTFVKGKIDVVLLEVQEVVKAICDSGSVKKLRDKAEEAIAGSSVQGTANQGSHDRTG